MGLVEHARTELERTDENDDYIDWMVSVVEQYASFRHSGGSHMVSLPRLIQLLDHGNLTPLTDDPAEWEDRSDISGYPVWQNTRNSRAFSENGGKTYYYVPIKDSGEVGTFTSESHDANV